MFVSYEFKQKSKRGDTDFLRQSQYIALIPQLVKDFVFLFFQIFKQKGVQKYHSQLVEVAAEDYLLYISNF